MSSRASELVIQLLVIAAAVVGCAHKAEQYFRADGFQASDTRGKRMALVVLDERAAVPAPGWCFANPGRAGCVDHAFEASGGFFAALVGELTREFAKSGVEVVRVPAPEVRLDRAEQPLRYAAQSRYELPSEVRDDLSEMAVRHGADLLLVLREWGLVYTATNGPVPRPATPSSPSSIPSASSSTAGAQAVGVSYRLSLEGAIFDADGSPLYHGRTSGGASQFLFFYKSAIRAAVSDAAVNFVKLTTGRWPAEDLLVVD